MMSYLMTLFHTNDHELPTNIDAADIFRGFMVSLYVKAKENGHVRAYSPNGVRGLK